METGTLLDIRNMLDPDGLPARIIEQMSTSGDLTMDAIWKESNDFGKHVTPRRSALPPSEFRRANRGVKPSKGAVTPGVDYIGYIESLSMVDDRVIRNVSKGSKQQTRADYDASHGQALAQTGRHYSIYGDRSVDPDAYDGAATKRGVISNHCFDAASDAPSDSRTSLYFFLWDESMGCHNIYPKDSKAGIETEDFGKQVIVDPENISETRFLPTWMTWLYYDLGFVVADDRALIRVANIDLEEESEAYFRKVYNLMQTALRTMTVAPDSGKVMIYGSIEALSFLDHMETTLPNVKWTPSEYRGKTYTDTFRGAPLRTCEEISNEEEAVTA